MSDPEHYGRYRRYAALVRMTGKPHIVLIHGSWQFWSPLGISRAVDATTWAWIENRNGRRVA